MNVSLYQAAAAMNSNAHWQEVISRNLAGSSVPAFKKEEMSFGAIQAGLMPVNGVNGPESFMLPAAQTGTNFQTGEFRKTGVNTDVAIEGKGFFEVQMSDGNLGYTRDGEFHISPNGELVTKDGKLVMGTAGTIQIDINSSEPISISETGEVSQGDLQLGQLKVVDFDNPQLLQRMGSGYYTVNSPDIFARNVANPIIRSGMLEGANTSPVAEMANMIMAMRLFETNGRLLTMQDENMGRTIRELSPVS